MTEHDKKTDILDFKNKPIQITSTDEWFGWDDSTFFDFEHPQDLPNQSEIDYDKLDDINENNIWFYYNNAETEEDRKKILDKPQIINYLQSYIIEQADYSHYESIYRIIEPRLTVHIFTPDFIKKYVSKISKYDQYKLFATMFNETKEKNKLLDAIMSNEELFSFFANEHHKMYSAVVLDQEHYLKLIEKIEKENLYSKFYMLSIDINFEDELLKEDYSIQTLSWLLDKVSKEAKSKFFQTDPRAPLTIPTIKEQVDSYITYGIKYGNHMIKHPDFFEMLKGPSLLRFRQLINILEDNCSDPHYIETKLQAYYETIIETYNPETKLFSCYDEILSDEDEYYKSQNDGYLVNSDVKWANGQKKEKYIDTTNKKLSELIVDYLFQDTIFNVWHNINQMLNYSRRLKDDECPVPKERLRFYELILKIDKISPEEKISIFHKLKNKNVNKVFYEDVRKTKDLAYKKIKEEMIDPTHPVYENQELTEKYGVTIMDLREEKFFMLVRTMNNYYVENASRRAASSYTLISDENTSTFGDEKIIYGYTDFDIDRVEHMFDFDSFSSAFEGSLNNSQGTTNHVNQILTADELANSAGYSEVIIKNQHTSEHQFDEMRPKFVVSKGEPTSIEIKASQLLNIPIVIIKEKKLHGGAHFITDETERYTSGASNEDERQAKR